MTTRNNNHNNNNKGRDFQESDRGFGRPRDNNRNYNSNGSNRFGRSDNFSRRPRSEDNSRPERSEYNNQDQVNATRNQERSDRVSMAKSKIFSNDGFRPRTDFKPRDGFRPRTDFKPRDGFRPRTDFKPRDEFRSRTDFKPRENKIVRVKLLNDNCLPERHTKQSVGYDLKITEDMDINPQSYALLPTGIWMELPDGVEGRITSRSSTLTKYNLYVAPGTIDPDYRGQVMIIVWNLGKEICRLSAGTRIAQLLFVPILLPSIEVVSELSNTSRGHKGFGSTGSGSYKSDDTNEQNGSEVNADLNESTKEEAIDNSEEIINNYSEV